MRDATERALDAATGNGGHCAAKNAGALERGLYKPVFIGGLPRSGTTFLSALVSTSQACNPFAPEHHSLGCLGQAMVSLSFPNQSLFYGNREVIIGHHFSLMRLILDEAWNALDRPKMLVIKHCSLTPLFGLIARHIPQALFLAIIRDPRDIFGSVIRSRLNANSVERPSDLLTERFIRQWIARFNGLYGALVRSADADLNGRLLALEHESLCTGDVSPLSTFLKVRDIDPLQLWKRSRFDIESVKEDPMFSNGWGQPLGKNASRSHRDILPPKIAQRVVQDTHLVSAAYSALAHSSHEVANDQPTGS